LAADEIVRLRGSAQGRSRATVGNGLVFTVATATSAGTTVAEQARATLATLDANLSDASSGRDLLLSATVYLADIGDKADFDAEWDAWIGPENWPQRACVQATLPPGTLVEITAIGAVRATADTEARWPAS
jgi:enamine deaminase RidA (YjgF/YER057c/UK114 family)